MQVHVIQILREASFSTASTIVLAVLGIVITLVVREKQKRKRLACDIHSHQLFSSVNNIHDKFAITFEGSPITDLRIVHLKLSNIGDIAIRREDYEKHISIDFPGWARVLDCTLHGKIPRELDVQFDVNFNRIAVQPLLLNPGDSFTMNIYVAAGENRMLELFPTAMLSQSTPTEVSPIPRIGIRIAGVQKVEKLVGNKIRRRSFYWGALLTFIGAAFMFYDFHLSRRNMPALTIWGKFGIACYFIGAGIAVMALDVRRLKGYIFRALDGR